MASVVFAGEYRLLKLLMALQMAALQGLKDTAHLVEIELLTMGSKGKNNSKNVVTERHKWTKSEREYIKGIIHNLSFQRLTDQEIVQWLHDEKHIDIGRSTVTQIKKKTQKQAEKWYVELRESRSKYIAIYKERLDSFYSYQKRLHQIIDFYIQPPDQMLYTDTVIRAISELHRIEISIFNIWK